MKLEFRQRLLTTTLLVGASMVATPALAQNAQLAQTTPPHPECPPGVPAGTANCNPPDTASGTGTQPETTTPQAAVTTPPSTSATGEPVRSAQDIVITGTRIPQPNLTSSSPITVVTSQEVKLQGTSRTEDLINSLPQSFAAQGSDISNGASGTATVNLRGLGQSRSMVLVNGRRLQPGDVLSPYPDINFVPTQLIKRVDILTGGASSVYGADAVGGVVNFIMDNTFTGVRLDAQGSVFQHDNRLTGSIIQANTARHFHPPTGLSTNGGARDLAGVIGAQFDDGRGHAQAYATYRTQDPVLQSSRDYSFCALSGLRADQVASTGRRFSCGGSATSATGTFLVLNPNTFTTTDVFQVGNGNQFVPGTTPFNFAPYNYFQRPDERYTLGAFADYEISPGAKPYVEAMFMDDHTDAQIAPSGDFGNTSLLNCDNPLLSAQEFQRLCVQNPTFVNPGVLNPTTGQPTQFSLTYVLRRNVEGGGRDDDIRHDDFRIVGGLRGDPLRGVSYDTYYQFGRTLRNETYLNDFSVTHLQRALDVVTNPATGLPVCRSVLTGVDTNCVPYNIFQTGGVTPAALAYLQTPGFQRGAIDEAIGHGDVTLQGAEYGLKTPWATNGIGINFGGEYRKQTMNFQVDQEFSSGDLAGQGGPTPPVSGAFDVREAFAEAQVPIVEHSFIDLLQLSAGFRYSNYVVSGTDPLTTTQVNNKFNTKTYKLAGEFAPIRDVRFRAAYNRAVRAPNIVELFFPTSLGLAGTEDPCAGAAPSATLAQCQLTGITPAQYGHISANPANQYNALFGGNANLQPEKADTYTAGVVLQPRFVPGLAATVDYFNIRIKNLIGSPGFADVFNQCFGGDAASCALVHRAPGTGSLWLGNQGFVILTNQNFKGLGLYTKGIDVSGAYNRRIGGMGTLNASFVGTYLMKLATPGATGNAVGRFSGSTPSPKWRHKLRLGFTLPDGLGISGQWRHFSAVHCRAIIGGLPADAGCQAKFHGVIYQRPGNLQLNQANFFDLALTARVTQKFNLRIGANNILDTAPPVAGGEVIPAGFGNGNTYPQVYDALGRYMFAGMTVDF